MNGPLIRLTVESMKHQIVTVLSEHELRLSGELKKAVSDAVDSFDFRAEIHAAVQRELREQVGLAAKAAVAEAVRRAAGNSLVIDAVALAVKTQLTEAAEAERRWERT